MFRETRAGIAVHDLITCWQLSDLHGSVSTTGEKVILGANINLRHSRPNVSSKYRAFRVLAREGID